MKKNILYLIACTFILASCSSKFSMTKRRYSKGFYVAHTHSADKPAPHRQHAKQAQAVDETVAVSEAKMVAAAAQPLSGQSDEKSMAAAVKKAPKAGKSARKQQSPAPENVLASAKKVNAAQRHSVAPLSISKPKGGGGDSNLIVWVILSLFPVLCLIAVYLHDGKAITLNFWIDLILHLTIYGECIFALLVVLDVIDLR